MQILQKLKSFGIETQDMVNIYILYVRSILEQSCQVWHFSLTLEDATTIEHKEVINNLGVLIDDMINFNAI